MAVTPGNRFNAPPIAEGFWRFVPMSTDDLLRARLAQRSSGAVATDGKAWIRGRKPTGRLRTCQPLIWKMR
jgi:hypothetical protein